MRKGPHLRELEREDVARQVRGCGGACGSRRRWRASGAFRDRAGRATREVEPGTPTAGTDWDGRLPQRTRRPASANWAALVAEHGCAVGDVLLWSLTDEGFTACRRPVTDDYRVSYKRIPTSAGEELWRVDWRGDVRARVRAAFDADWADTPAP